MSLVPTIYSSTDPGAPGLSGTVGSLVALLDAILVNGYGAGPTAKAGLGWTIEFTAANKRAYRGNLESATGYYLRVDDSNARYALVRGYSTMSTVDSGSDQLPPAATRPDGELWPKSSAADATNRRWWAIGNERCLYLWMEVEVQAAGHADAPVFFFGDFISNRAGDAHAFGISHSLLTSYAGVSGSTLSYLWYTINAPTLAPTANNATMCVARAMSGNEGSVYVNAAPLVGQTALAVGRGNIAYPIYEAGPMVYERIGIMEAGPLPRGRFPGVFGHMHLRPFAELATVSTMLNKNFRAGPANVSNGLGQVFFETAVEWT